MTKWALSQGCKDSSISAKWCFWTVVLEKTLESPLDCKEIQPVHSEGDPPWDFFGRKDAKAETPVLWPPHAKSWLIGEDSDAGRDWGHEEKGTTEDEMVGWHHWLDGRESEWTLGVGDGQGSLVCCDSWGRKESDTIEATELNWKLLQTHWHLRTHYWTLHCTSERRNPAPPTRTPTQASLARKPWEATHRTPPTVRKLHNKENSTNCQNTERPPQTQQYKQDEETEECLAGKGTG